MRVLVTTTGGAGHFGPLVPFAEAVRAAGGEILFATRTSTAHTVRAAGYEVAEFADAPAEPRAAIFGSVRELSNDDANVLVVSEIFARIDARAALPDVLATCATWRPDVVLSEACEFAGPLAASHLGLPAVTVGIGLATVERLVMDATNAALRDVCAELGLDARPGETADRFTLFPPLLDHPAPAGVRRFREHEATPAPLPVPPNEDPLVYLTFGSVAPQGPFFPDLYRAAIDALAPLPIRLLVTVGRDRDPADLGPLPRNVQVERWVPQADVTPHAAAIVCHGGSGTVLAALSGGVPLVVLPLFADQPDNARRVAELGAGIALEGIAGIADATRAVLAHDRYRERAADVAADVRALPPVDAAAAILQRIAGTRALLRSA